jgi:hypothetical protein
VTAATFIVLTSDEKSGVMYPQIIGPFDGLTAAGDWIRASVPDEADEWLAGYWIPPDGGYAGVVLVCAQSATDPDVWATEHAEMSQDSL